MVSRRSKSNLYLYIKLISETGPMWDTEPPKN